MALTEIKESWISTGLEAFSTSSFIVCYHWAVLLFCFIFLGIDVIACDNSIVVRFFTKGV